MIHLNVFVIFWFTEAWKSYRRHFQMNFLDRKHWYFDSYFTGLLLMGSSNGLAPNRRQAITWTNDDQGFFLCHGIIRS